MRTLPELQEAMQAEIKQIDRDLKPAVYRERLQAITTKFAPSIAAARAKAENEIRKLQNQRLRLLDAVAATILKGWRTAELTLAQAAALEALKSLPPEVAIDFARESGNPLMALAAKTAVDALPAVERQAHTPAVNKLLEQFIDKPALVKNAHQELEQLQGFENFHGDIPQAKMTHARRVEILVQLTQGTIPKGHAEHLKRALGDQTAENVDMP